MCKNNKMARPSTTWSLRHGLRIKSDQLRGFAKRRWSLAGAWRNRRHIDPHLMSARPCCHSRADCACQTLGETWPIVCDSPLPDRNGLHCAVQKKVVMGGPSFAVQNVDKPTEARKDTLKAAI